MPSVVMPKVSASKLSYLDVLNGLRDGDPLHGGFTPELLVLHPLLLNLTRNLWKIL
jgi:hypothetical protein